MVGVVQPDGEELPRPRHRGQQFLIGQRHAAGARVQGATSRLHRLLAGGQEPAHAARQFRQSYAQVDDGFLVRQHADRGPAIPH